jgi:hypothetical protein
MIGLSTSLAAHVLCCCASCAPALPTRQDDSRQPFVTTLKNRSCVLLLRCLCSSPPHAAGLRQDLHVPNQARMRLQTTVQLVRASMQVLRDATSALTQPGPELRGKLLWRQQLTWIPVAIHAENSSFTDANACGTYMAAPCMQPKPSEILYHGVLQGFIVETIHSHKSIILHITCYMLPGRGLKL